MYEATKDIKENASRDSRDNTGGNHLVDEVKKMARNFKSDASDAATAAKDDLEGVARQTGAHMREFVDTAGHSIKNAGGAVALMIRDNPVQSTLLALGVGLLAGIIYRR